MQVLSWNLQGSAAAQVRGPKDRDPRVRVAA